ncbi:MAG: GIY-YIG nuclease family protein [Bacteroidetes bacterium]|nr:GIY-YIG nuclease family protein [Bacteroidota bacterium]
MSFCYILFSKSLNRFYIGCTQKTVEARLGEHLSKVFEGSFTGHASDWELFHSISCENYHQALKIEQHIKKMKSKVYLENLKKHPEITERLLVKYKV